MATRNTALAPTEPEPQPQPQPQPERAGGDSVPIDKQGVERAEHAWAA